MCVLTSANHTSNQAEPSTLVQVRYDERGSREEEWLRLGRSRFSWLSEPAAGCPSNPTVIQGLTPVGTDAVDHKVKLACLTEALDSLSCCLSLQQAAQLQCRASCPLERGAEMFC